MSQLGHNDNRSPARARHNSGGNISKAEVCNPGAHRADRVGRTRARLYRSRYPALGVEALFLGNKPRSVLASNDEIQSDGYRFVALFSGLYQGSRNRSRQYRDEWEKQGSDPALKSQPQIRSHWSPPLVFFAQRDQKEPSSCRTSELHGAIFLCNASTAMKRPRERSARINRMT